MIYSKRNFGNKKNKKNIVILLIITALAFSLILPNPLSLSSPKPTDNAKAQSQNIWPMFGYNPQHTGQCPYSTKNNHGTLKWKYRTNDKIYSSPAISSDGTIYVGSDDHYLYAIGKAEKQSESSEFTSVDLTNIIPDYIDYLTSWAEDGDYYYVGAIKRNETVYIYKIKKSDLSLVLRLTKNIQYVDRFVIGFKWGRIYAAAECKVDDNTIDTPVYWYIYEISPDNIWTQIFSTEHREGGFTNYLISTNNYIYIVGYYSSCCAWGTKIIRISQSNDCKIWTSPTGEEFYNNEHGFTTGDKIIFYHQAPFNNPILFEEHLEDYGNWLSSYTKVNYNSYVNRAEVFEIDSRKFFLANVSRGGGYDVHLLNYPVSRDVVVYKAEGLTSFQEPFLSSNGFLYEIFADNTSGDYYILKTNSQMNYEVIKTPFNYKSGDVVYFKFMHKVDNDPGCVVTTKDKRFLIYSLQSPSSTPPLITITHPLSNKTYIETNSITITGTVKDQESGVDKLTINGNLVSVSSDGSFNTTVYLIEGENTITITATDKAGNKSSKTITIIYTKPITTIKIILQIGNPYMYVNNIKKEIDPGRGTTPIIKNNRTLVPIRAIVEALGGTIQWDPTTRGITIILNNTTIILQIDNSFAYVNGIQKQIDPSNPKVVPIIINGRTMLPLRFVSENLGCQVAWEPKTKTITLIYENEG